MEEKSAIKLTVRTCFKQFLLFLRPSAPAR